MMPAWPDINGYNDYSGFEIIVYNVQIIVLNIGCNVKLSEGLASIKMKPTLLSDRVALVSLAGNLIWSLWMFLINPFLCRALEASVDLKPNG